MAKTFTDGKGKVRPMRAAATKVKAPKLSPIDQAANSTIAGQVTPYQSALAERDRQYKADRADGSSLDAALTSDLSGLRTTAANSGADALALAAQRNTGSQDQMARNQSFLQNVLGGYVTDGGAGLASAGGGTAVAAGADNAQNAMKIALGGKAITDQLTAQQGAASMQGRERASQLLASMQADQRALGNQIAAIKSTRPAVRQKLLQEWQDRKMAAAELGLNRQQLQQQDDQFYAGLGAEQQADKPKKGVYGFGEDKDAPVGSVLDALAAKVAAEQAGKPVKWDAGGLVGDAILALSSRAGLTTTQAALQAAKVYPEAIKGLGAFGAITTLRRRGVPDGIIRNIVERPTMFGKGAFKAASKQTFAGNLQNVTQGIGGLFGNRPNAPSDSGGSRPPMFQPSTNPPFVPPPNLL